LNQLGWKDLIDISITPGEAGRGRPHPDMLQKAAESLGIVDPANVIVLGDTAADMQAALAFGASQAIGVLTGAHDKDRLINAGATSVINSVADLKSLI
jgi:HAD superfamily hydrolase (TIGR01509 family)